MDSRADAGDYQPQASTVCPSPACYHPALGGGAAIDKARQAKLVDWLDIKDNPPIQLKISPISMIPHKLQKYQTILDLTFPLHMMDGTRVTSANEALVKMVPHGAID